jgi:outer membrane lipoprotein-sorting protein
MEAALWKSLSDIDARAARIQSLSASFQQQKFTALLTRPLVSSGVVKIRGAQIRWDTAQPEKSVLLMDPRHVEIFYPAQKVLEVYTVDQRMGELAASPLPRLEVLKKQFSIRQVPAADLQEKDQTGRFIALSLEPSEASLRQHVQQVRVLLDVGHACLVKAEITDSDGERTLLSFSDVRINVDVGELGLTVPTGTKISHPLEGLEGSPSQRKPK